MRLSLVFTRLLALLLVTSNSIASFSQSPATAPELILPQQIGTFQSQGPARRGADFEVLVSESRVSASDFHVVARVERDYQGYDGQRYRVVVTSTASPSAAYSILTFPNGIAGHYAPKLRFVSGLGVVSSAGPLIKFVKGRNAVTVESLLQGGDGESVLEFAQTLSSSLEGDVGIVPELVFHMPEWETKYVQRGPDGIGYAVSRAAVQALMKSGLEEQPIVDAISFDGGAEAVTAKYSNGRLLIVEFTTPQYAGDSDKIINERIGQLRSEGKPVPSSYRRVGNYAVFVFDAPNDAVADELLGTVKYEKDVRWLGRNPHENEIAIRAYTNTMTGVIVTVIKTTGLAIVACLGFGALVGGIVFLRRRARTSASEVYSDAGGMVRLDLLDDVSVPPASRNLVSSRKD